MFSQSMSKTVRTKITYRALITTWEVMRNPEKPVRETTEAPQLPYQDTSPSTGNFAMPAVRRGDQGVQQAVWNQPKWQFWTPTGISKCLLWDDMSFWPHDI